MIFFRDIINALPSRLLVRDRADSVANVLKHVYIKFVSLKGSLIYWLHNICVQISAQFLWLQTAKLWQCKNKFIGPPYSSAFHSRSVPNNFFCSKRHICDSVSQSVTYLFYSSEVSLSFSVYRHLSEFTNYSVLSPLFRLHSFYFFLSPSIPRFAPVVCWREHSSSMMLIFTRAS